MRDKCKNCGLESVLELIKDFEYQFEPEDEVQVFNVLKCPICGCIHWEIDNRQYYQYEKSTDSYETISSVGNWKI